MPASAAATLTPEDRRTLLGFAARLVAVLLLLMGAGALAAALYREPMLAAGAWFVTHLGAPGVGVAFFVTDVLPVPVPPDTFAAMALVGGVPFPVVVAWATAGSVLGGTGALFFGRWLARRGWYRRVMERFDSRVDHWVRRYGDAALVAIIFLPVPFEVGAWACGAMGMPVGRFMAFALLRGVRITLYLGLFVLGWAGGGG
jgi:membrane protein YqaA with SNARE-associated domain